MYLVDLGEVSFGGAFLVGEGYENYNEVVQFTGGIFALVLHGIGF